MSRGALVLSVGVLLVGCQPAGSVGPNRSPTAEFDAPGLAREGSPVAFHGEAADPDHDPLTFTWDFGDGVALETRHAAIQHVYRNNGSYSVALIVTDPSGAADTAARTITVANVEPQITMFTVPATATAGVPFNVEIQYSDPGVDDTLTASLWLWHGDSGEGGTLHGPAIVPFNLTDPGQYSVSIYVGDNDGGSSYRQATINVIAAATSTIVATGARQERP